MITIPETHSGGTWRDSARERIAQVIAEVGRGDEKALRKALREAYPWGERKMWPYKVWCSEARIQLGQSTRAWPRRGGKRAAADRQDQMRLF